MKTGIATLPLHGGKCPAWLFNHDSQAAICCDLAAAPTLNMVSAANSDITYILQPRLFNDC